jgi:hypothetical protein
METVLSIPKSRPYIEGLVGHGFAAGAAPSDRKMQSDHIAEPGFSSPSVKQTMGTLRSFQEHVLCFVEETNTCVYDGEEGQPGDRRCYFFEANGESNKARK